MKNAFYFPVAHNATFGERITALRKSKGIKSVQGLAEEIFDKSEKYNRTGVPDTDNATIESIRKRIASHLKANCNPKMEFIKEYCDFFHCEADFLLGYIDFPTKENQSIHDITGLNDTSIEMLKFLNMNNGVTQSGHNEMETLNIFLSDMDFVLGFLGGLQDFINARYKIPIYHTGKHEVINGYFQPQCVVPDNEYDTIDNIPLLTLAKTKENPQDNYSIPLTDTFFESIALKTIEKSIIDLRNTLNRRSDADETT